MSPLVAAAGFRDSLEALGVCIALALAGGLVGLVSGMLTRGRSRWPR